MARTAVGTIIFDALNILNLSNIKIGPNSVVDDGVMCRADLASIKTGKYCHLCKESMFIPGVKCLSESSFYVDITMGDYVVVGPRTLVRSGKLGSFVHIGADCILDTSSSLLDCCVVLDGTVIPPDTVVPPRSVVAGNPGRIVGTTPLSFKESLEKHVRELYENAALRLDEL